MGLEGTLPPGEQGEHGDEQQQATHDVDPRTSAHLRCAVGPARDATLLGCARVVELADTTDSKSVGLTVVRVQVPPRARALLFLATASVERRRHR